MTNSENSIEIKASTSKSAISKKTQQKALNELQISENLKKQADELTVEYKFEDWNHVDQVLYAYAKMKGFVWRLQNTYYRVDKSISKKIFECQHAGKPKPHKSNDPDKIRATKSIRAQLDIGLEYNVALILPEQYESFKEDFIYENDPNSDDYADFAQISLESIISQIDKTKIIEVWRVMYLTHNPKLSPHFVILFHDKSHICTCLMILNHGLVCRHFFQVMIRSKQAYFSISLIKKRWFKLEVNQINAELDIEDSDNPNCQEQEFIDITGQHSCITQSSTILSIFREDLEDKTNDVNKKIEKRHLYSNLFGLGRKIAQIATEKRRYDVLDTFNQVLDELYDDTNEETSESASKKILNPHVIKCRGRPSFKRQKSSVEIHKDKQDGNHSNKESRACSNCEQTNHNVHQCSAPCKLCKQNGHTYLRYKGKNVN
ncbi:hypothetical protein C2G38_2146300 [Gigaspora rosea]|uniref:SWIM-type domain-containing protein n=1 Tax=Gigaspora rosea TaxID=44941 RepID=A0A397ULC5_9GLOM|nr:hypothetical protein C2G38_2146300 [Gigaspora rosea]